MKTPVIIDTDPGIDDAVALITSFFAPSIDIKLLCSTAGNLGIDVTTQNVLHLCELYEKNIPVAKGLPHPLRRELITTNRHGKNGLGTYEYDGVKTTPIELPAFEAMHYALQLYPGTTILVMGPLTNVAKLLEVYPDDIHKIKEIVFMGGTKDNVLQQDKPYPEFNISRDPEACELVLNSGANITIIPMDFGHYAYIDEHEIKRLRSINETGKLFSIMYEEYKDGHVTDENAATHDSCATAYLIEPTLFKFEYVKATIQFFEGKGILVTEVMPCTTNFKLAIDMDYDGFKNLYYGLLGIAKKPDEML